MLSLLHTLWLVPIKEKQHYRWHSILFFCKLQHKLTTLLPCSIHLFAKPLPRFITATTNSYHVSQLSQGWKVVGVLQTIHKIANCLLYVYNLNCSKIVFIGLSSNFKLQINQLLIILSRKNVKSSYCYGAGAQDNSCADYFWSIVCSHLSYNRSWFIHQSCLAITIRHLLAK
jgi:hypothetical protein